ncbi:ATP-binding protein [Streptomyces sp. WAC 00631]|uniref:ATP-binding protein n=1 Tax=Streptomyces sp. WAC 00631 TaxID=2203201 RepID=UPI001E557BD1|nr:ATP-binding protein [Streptomyces sp. WAC 00631]MCC5032813.1 ATP-binding protein [Streptomyces sp. WAC 00631]
MNSAKTPLTGDSRPVGTPVDLNPGKLPRDIEWRLPRHARSVSRARTLLREQARSWHLPEETVETAALLLSELVTNAYRHARTSPGRQISIRCVADGPALRVEVSDAGDEMPRLRLATEADESGRGLALVNALADWWGAHRRPCGIGKTVWFELGLPTTDGPDADGTQEVQNAQEMREVRAAEAAEAAEERVWAADGAGGADGVSGVGGADAQQADQGDGWKVGATTELQMTALPVPLAVQRHMAERPGRPPGLRTTDSGATRRRGPYRGSPGSQAGSPRVVAPHCWTGSTPPSDRDGAGTRGRVGVLPVDAYGWWVVRLTAPGGRRGGGGGCVAVFPLSSWRVLRHPCWGWAGGRSSIRCRARPGSVRKAMAWLVPVGG